jgi:hypothetical protein
MAIRPVRCSFKKPTFISLSVFCTYFDSTVKGLCQKTVGINKYYGVHYIDTLTVAMIQTGIGKVSIAVGSNR